MTNKTDGGGKRFNEGKPRVDLLVPEAMLEEAKVWEYGAKKYGDRNWQRGMAWTIVLASLFRHLLKIMMGQDYDEETGLLHLAHIKANTSMLIWYFYHYKKGDDRIKPEKNNE